MSAKPQKEKRVTLQFNYSDGSSNEASDIRSRLKSPTEIADFSMPEDLPELERVAQLLDSRNELQRLAGVSAVARCVPDFGAAAFISLFRRFSRAVQRGDAELQREAANTLVKVLPEVNDSEFLVASCIPFIQKTILSIDGTMPQWVEALIVAAIAADRASIESVAAFALQCSGADQCSSLRATACRLLSWLCTVQPIRPSDMAELLEAIRFLCQDIDKEVRSAMASQLAAVASKLDGQGREQVVLKEILELIADEEIVVKVAAFSAFVDMIPSLTSVIGFDRIMSSVIRLYKEAESTPSSGLQSPLRLEAARLLGVILHRISLNNTSSMAIHTTYLLDLYRTLLQDPAASIRRLCAYNMPAVVQFCGRGQNSSYVQSTLIALVSDTDPEVRLTTACGFHELLSLVARDKLTMLLKPCFFKLLKDADLRVQIAIVSRIDEIVAAFRKFEGHQETNMALAPMVPKSPLSDVSDGLDAAESNMNSEERILRALLEYETRLDLRWREREILFKKLGALCSVLKPELILQLWKETILQTMHSDARPVQLAAATTLVVLMRHQTRWVTRIEICQHLINDFCQSTTSTDRLLFLDICPVVSEHFSRRWYRDRILDNAISLSDDDVPAVRARACQLLPEHRRQFGSQPASDDESSERCTTSVSMLDKIVERLSIDTDQYVQEAARVVSRNLCNASSADPNYESVDRAKEASEEAVFHDDCSNFSADFFKIKKSVSMSSLTDPVPTPVTKPPITGAPTKGSLTSMSSSAMTTSAAIKARAKTKARKQALEASKVTTETSSDSKHVKVPTLPTRFIGNVSSVKSPKSSHSSSIPNGKKR